MPYRLRYLKAVRLASEIAWKVGEIVGGAGRAGGSGDAPRGSDRSAGGVAVTVMRQRRASAVPSASALCPEAPGEPSPSGALEWAISAAPSRGHAGGVRWAPGLAQVAPRRSDGAMTLEIVLFAAFRVATSLPVLRWPLAGGLLAIGGDLADLLLRDLVDLGGVGDYQLLDKALDQVYLALFLVVALRWRGVERRVAVALYLYRLVGSILFLVTGERAVLFLFPNVFEPWFILVAAIHHLPAAAAAGRRPASPPSWRSSRRSSSCRSGRSTSARSSSR